MRKRIVCRERRWRVCVVGGGDEDHYSGTAGCVWVVQGREGLVAEAGLREAEQADAKIVRLVAGAGDEGDFSCTDGCVGVVCTRTGRNIAEAGLHEAKQADVAMAHRRHRRRRRLLWHH
ncbi:hypothetical protein TIFTF001_029440 [Ficus carica]|uniref:Uncharacterized protein n=1 Tax=Ficus carica TaxID=3494 RepID=A0AA88DRV4_FICCA|nr:hypothetical protein TIFTF001_029440 [Ficus carica]